MSYAAVIQVGQVVHCFHTVVFFGVIEPSRTDRNVTFGSYPLVTVGMTVLQFAIVRITRIDLSGTKERPVGRSCKSFLIAYPTTTRPTIREDNRLWLQFVNHLVSSRIIIISFAVDSTAVFCTAIPAIAAISTVEPDFKNVTVVGQ